VWRLPPAIGEGDSRFTPPSLDTYKDMLMPMSGADFAVTCAGAITLSELARIGLPALLVPPGQGGKKSPN